MTNDEIRIAIAKAKYERVEIRGCEFGPDCGDLYEVQTMNEQYPEYRSISERYMLWPCRFVSYLTEEDVVYEHWDPVPDWPNDIAAAWDLEEELPDDARQDYADRLAEIIECEGLLDFEYWFKMAHATAKQRCEAWLAWKTAQK